MKSVLTLGQVRYLLLFMLAFRHFLQLIAWPLLLGVLAVVLPIHSQNNSAANPSKAPRGGIKDANKKKLFLWKVEQQRHHVFLLGAVAVLHRTSYPLDPGYITAYKNSDAIAVDTDPSPQSQVRAREIMNRMGRLPKGQKIKDVLSNDVYQRLVARSKSLNVSMATFDPLKPWLVGLILPQYRKLSAKRYYGGARSFFINMAQAKQKPVEVLQAWETYFKIFDQLSPVEQEAFLDNTLLEFGNMRDIDKLIRAWEMGDVVTLQLLIDKFPNHSKILNNFRNKLFAERNKKLLKKIIKLLKSKKTYLIILGAGNMVGDDGLTHMLRKAGFRVTRLSSQ